MAEVVIIGAGAGGLVAAMRALEAGAEVLVLEADPLPQGSTALSAGLIPGAGTRAQAAAGVTDSPEGFARDILAKAKGEPDAKIVRALTETSGPALDWLMDRGLDLTVVTDFTYPGHSAHRMHGLPSRAGRDLIDALRAAAERMGVTLVTERRVTDLTAEAGRVTALTCATPDGATETIPVDRLILACNGFGGNAAMVAAEMPEIAEALYFGHPGNRGEAVTWGRDLGAATRHLGAYQGHGNVAHPQGILITWATITEGGIQVNALGQRFWDESQGYSEAARAVLAQPGGRVWTIFDARIADVARQFEDFRQAEALGAIRKAASVAELAEVTGLPQAALAQTMAGVGDRFGRDIVPVEALAPPYCAVQVTGALFHTQGGLQTDGVGRVLRPDGTALPNLWAIGGAACGVSGAGDGGYLSGNGLLSAVALAFQAGADAAP